MLRPSVMLATTPRDGRFIVIDLHGAHLELHEVGDGPALLVSPITDAIKIVDGSGRVVRSLDRSGLAKVEGFVLDRETVERLDDVEMTPAQLIASVRHLGVEWELSEIDSA